MILTWDQGLLINCLKKERENAKEPTNQYEASTPPAQQDKGFYKKSELSETETKQLLNNRYIISEHVGLFGGRREAYLLKPRHNEGAEHFFTVKAIEEYLRQYTDKVVLYETTKPDIVFKANGREVAVEVETGVKYKTARKKLEKMVENNNQKYGDNWFFVVTDVKGFKREYSSYKTTYARRETLAVLKELFKGVLRNQEAAPQKEHPDLKKSRNSNSEATEAKSLENSQMGNQKPILNNAQTA